MNWMSRKDKQLNFKRKHGNLNYIDQITNNNKNIFADNSFNKHINKQETCSDHNVFYKLVSKIIS
jgi:hypothetical protein